jgi:hypothetical protein
VLAVLPVVVARWWDKGAVRAAAGRGATKDA